jgi:hypothetical protein
MALAPYLISTNGAEAAGPGYCLPRVPAGSHDPPPGTVLYSASLWIAMHVLVDSPTTSARSTRTCSSYRSHRPAVCASFTVGTIRTRPRRERDRVRQLVESTRGGHQRSTQGDRPEQLRPAVPKETKNVPLFSDTTLITRRVCLPSRHGS